MSSKVKLIKILSENKINSGETIAEKLGVSRNMVWKWVNSLISDGFDVISSPKGYSLISFPQKITAEEMCLYCDDYFDVQVFDTLPSTNAYCREHLKEFNGNTLIVARKQLEGKGRLEREFYSPENGLYMSFCFKESLDVSLAPHITLYTAVMVAEAIESLCEASVKIKWVNDLFINEKKVCGILSEATVSCEEKRINNFIVGIGVNVNTKEFPNMLKDIATSLSLELQKPVNTSILAGIIAKKMATLPVGVTKKDFLKDYKRRCFIIGKTVYIDNKPAKALDVCDDGSLLVESYGERKKLYAGEVSIKL